MAGFYSAVDSESDWRGVSFVGGRKTTLDRLFREKGITLTAEARARFDALPDQFLVFHAEQQEYLALLDAKVVPRSEAA